MKPPHIRIFMLIGKLTEMVGALMFLAIFAGFILLVVARYVFHWPLGWPDEAISTLFVWSTFWVAAFNIRLEDQISFDLLQNALPARIRAIANIIANGICASLFVAAIPITIDFLIFSNRQATPVLDIPLSIVYLPLLFFIIATPLRMGFFIRSLVLELRANPLEKDGHQAEE